jgi:hypothetical protein
MGYRPNIKRMIRIFRSKARHGMRAVSCSFYLMVSPALASGPAGMTVPVKPFDTGPAVSARVDR